MADLWYRKDAPKIAKIYGTGPSWDSSETDLKFLSKFDLIMTGYDWETQAQKEKLNDNLKRIHDMNPRLKLMFYLGGACEYARGTKYFSDDCFLRTTEGDFINSWPGSCLLNLSKPETLAAYMDLFADNWPRDLDMDGVYIDNMNGSFDAWAVELVSRKKVQVDANLDGLEDDRAELDRLWKAGKLSMLRSLRETYGEEPYIVINGTMGSDYAKAYADGTILEDKLDHLIIPEAYSRFSFDEILERYRVWDDVRPGRVNCTYINTTPGIDISYDQHSIPFEENNRLFQKSYESLQRMRFGLAFALLGDGHFTFQLHTRWLGQQWWYPEYDIPIGKPLGAYYKHADGTYRRDYENAVVVLNNTYHDIQPHFDQTMRDGTTSWVGRDFNLPSKDGRIYIRVGL